MRASGYQCLSNWCWDRLCNSTALFRTINRNVWTIYCKLTSMNGRLLGRTASFVSTECFSLLVFNSVLYMLQNPPTVLSFIYRLFVTDCLAASGSTDGSILSNFESNIQQKQSSIATLLKSHFGMGDLL